MKPNFNLLTVSGALVLLANSANAAGVYDNNISALNINMLTDVFMSYTDYGTQMSDLFKKHKIYGTMTRYGEYGDDGSTLKTLDGETAKSDKYFIKDIWLNANHINADMHYGNNVSQHGRFNLATVGATTRTSELKYGNISFGGFASYINTKMPEFHSFGDSVGLFSNYHYRNFGAKTLLNIGSLNNRGGGDRFNNSWANIATGASAMVRIDDTFFVRPDIYASYTFVSSDDLYANGDKISSKDYNFFNIAPSVTFIKEISKNWYGSISAKYLAHFGGKNDITVGNTTIDGLYLDSHTDIGIDVEHNFKSFVFGAKVHKQLGDMDGWSANINAKYAF